MPSTWAPPSSGTSLAWTPQEKNRAGWIGEIFLWVRSRRTIIEGTLFGKQGEHLRRNKTFLLYMYFYIPLFIVAGKSLSCHSQVTRVQLSPTIVAMRDKYARWISFRPCHTPNPQAKKPVTFNPACLFGYGWF